MNIAATFCALMVGHALCDYPLQGPFLSAAKNPMEPIPGVPWWQAMTGHAIIHGGAVGLITGVWWLGVAEALTHYVIDYAKCRRVITFNQDQAGHVLCKMAWLSIVLAIQK